MVMSDDLAARVPARIRTRCPSCGFDTLIIGSGGWLVCSWLECKDPGAINHVAEQAARVHALIDQWTDYANTCVPGIQTEAMKQFLRELEAALAAALAPRSDEAFALRLAQRLESAVRGPNNAELDIKQAVQIIQEELREHAQQ